MSNCGPNLECKSKSGGGVWPEGRGCGDRGTFRISSHPPGVVGGCYCHSPPVLHNEACFSHGGSRLLTLRILSSVPQLSSFTHRHSLKILAELEDKFPMKNTGEYTYPSISGKTKTPRILLNYTWSSWSNFWIYLLNFQVILVSFHWLFLLKLSFRVCTKSVFLQLVIIK